MMVVMQRQKHVSSLNCESKFGKAFVEKQIKSWNEIVRD
jgi:hypothetical protein